METLEYRTIDKSSWGDGPWQDEPDKKQWQDVKTGYPCLIVRGHSGALCGYVGVTDGHPLFQKDYDQPSISVHGGLTFGGFCQSGETESKGICHKPGPGEPDHVWWFGFDCAHSGDETPYIRSLFLNKYFPYEHTTYKDLKYVENEVRNLAAQLFALAEK